MSDTQEPMIDATDTEAPAPAATVDMSSEVEKWKALARKNEERAKANADAAKRLEEIEAAQMTEADKAKRERDALASKLAEYESQVKAATELKAKEEAAITVSKELGYPSVDKALKLARYLDGDDLAAAARAMFDDFKPSPSGVPAAVHDVLADDPAKKDPFVAGMMKAMGK